jgi:hypothetical protein
LPLLDDLDRETELLADLIVGRTIEIRHACVHVDHNVESAQHVLTRVLFIVDEVLGQIPFITAITVDGHAT